MSGVFVDTGAWFASLVPSDPDHAAAANWLKENREQLITTDYCLDELLTLLRMRGENARALLIGEKLISQQVARLEHVGPADLDQAWHFFRSFQDKQWSFTDCVSRAVIERLGIHKAFAFDDHFRQFGTVAVVP